MKKYSLNGLWQYRIGKGEFSTITVPFSKLPVGHFECKKAFDIEENFNKIFIKFCGITYYAKVFLNDVFLGEMGPYCEYSFNVTDFLKAKDNIILLEMEDTSPVFGPTAGWENFGGIIRDVELIGYDENHIEDVFFYSTLLNNYSTAEITVETKLDNAIGYVKAELFWANELVAVLNEISDTKVFKGSINNVNLWSPDTPNLYRLKVTLTYGDKELDVYDCMVGFREFVCDKHRFCLNGKPLFLKGVCKHEMFGDSGHCPSMEQMRYDLQMIKDTGCNFVRLVHYPHNKRILDIADEIGLMVSEEPGLWWSDTSDPDVRNGSLEVLHRTILRDRNHPSIIFWLAFNECKFTKEYLIESAKVCRANDHTRLVSGANCMSNEETLEYYNLCGFDFYTMHPYSQTIERAQESAQILNDKPLLFTEWGGHFVYDNPKLLAEFIDEMYKLYLNNSEDGALAGACFWEWSELNDFNRGMPACKDGMLYEGLVDANRKPNLIYKTFMDSIKNLGKSKETEFWFNLYQQIKPYNKLKTNSNSSVLKKIVNTINDEETQSGKLRKRRLINGPFLNDVENLLNVPYVIADDCSITFDCDFKTKSITLYGLVSIIKGYPLAGEYGEKVAKIIINYEDGEKQSSYLSNGTEITTVFETNLSSRINPVAENSKRVLNFGYDKNFERYILNSLEITTDYNKTIKNISLVSQNNGYALLIYGIS